MSFKYYKRNNFIRYFISTTLLLVCSLLLSGCNKQYSPSNTVSGIYFDTYVNITAYDNTSKEVLNNAISLCNDYENIFSKTLEGSELYILNHSHPASMLSDYEISEPLYDVLSFSQSMSQKTNSLFNPAIGSITQLWSFNSDKPFLPNDNDVKNALLHTSCNSFSLSNSNNKYYITITDPDIQFDLGGIAKGYIANCIKDYLVSNNCTEAVIALGGNLYCIGSKGGNGYNIGIQKPFSNKGEAITTIQISNASVVTSGIYERYFYYNEKLYHHILDTNTGYPVVSDLAGATIISEDSMLADALSTAVLAMGSSNGKYYLETQYPTIKAYLVTIDNEIISVN